MSSGRNWILFIAGLMFSSFLGGVFNIAFSPQEVTQFVTEIVNRKEPKFQLAFNSARLSLADGWWPQIAIELNDISVVAKDKCLTASTLKADRLVVPLKFRSLFSDKIRFGDIHAGQVHFYKMPNPCVNKSKPTLEKDEFKEENLASIERFFRNRWTKEVVNTTQVLSSLEIDSLAFHSEEEEPIWSVSSVYMEFSKEKGQSHLSFNVDPLPAWTGSQPFGTTEITATIEADEVVLSGVGNLNEGQFSIRANWIVETGKYSFQINGQDLPLQNVLGFAGYWGAFPSLKAKFRNQWMTCQWVGEGDVRRFPNAHLKISHCDVDGDLGYMHVQDTELELKKETGPFPIIVELRGIDLKKGLSTFGFGGSWGLVSEFGRFDGKLFVKSAKNLEISGYVENGEIHMTSPAGRTKLRIRKFNLDLSYDVNRFSGKVSNIEIENGLVKGGMSFNLSEAGEGALQLALENIQLPIATQKVLFFEGRIPNFEVYGLGFLENAKLKKFSGHIGVSSFETQQWVLEGTKAELRLDEDIWHVKLQAQKFYVKPESKWRVMAYTLVSESDKKPNDLFFQKIKGDLKFLGDAGDFLSISAALPDLKLTISSEGKWTNKGELSGALSANYGNKKSVKWKLIGHLQQPIIEKAN